MANEVTQSVAMSVSKGGAAINSGTLSKTSDMDAASIDMPAVTATASTTTAALPVPAAISFACVGGVDILFKNLSTTAGESIRLGNANADPITSLISTVAPGKSVLLVGLTAAPYVESASGSPFYQFWAVET